MIETPPELLPPPVAAVQKPKRFRLLGLLPYILGAICAVAIGSVFGPGPLGETKNIIIPHGAGPREMAAILASSGAIYDPLVFRVAAKLLASNVLKAGEYQLNAGISAAEIAEMIQEGHSVTRLFAVAEGLTSDDILRSLEEMPTLGGDKVPMPPEGSLLPETYRYMYGDSRASLVTRMQKSMQDTLADLWAKRDPSVPLTSPEQAVVMASVIEKETGKAAERPRIAGVFYNRLRLHMRLQSDPTVIYAITKARGTMDHDIDHADLAFPSPYNTYTSDGLPPAPICNPGRAAIEAALHPETHDYLYFVADGTGGHVFSRNLAEHNQNVAKWNRVKPQ